MDGDVDEGRQHHVNARKIGIHINSDTGTERMSLTVRGIRSQRISPGWYPQNAESAACSIKAAVVRQGLSNGVHDLEIG